MTTPKWTTDPPTEPGWYWLDDPFGNLHVVEVDDHGPNGFVYWDATDPTEPPKPTKVVWGKIIGGQIARWAGPLAPPEADG